MTDSLMTATALSGVTQLTTLGVIRAVGIESRKFLQGQLTQDIENLGPDRATLAAFCNAKGRMQASFIVFNRMTSDACEETLLVCSRDLLAQTLKRMSMFVMRAKVTLSDASEDFLLYGISGAANQPFDKSLNAINTGAAGARIYWSKAVFNDQISIQMYPGAGMDRLLWCAPVGAITPSGPPLALRIWQWLEAQSGVAMVTLPIFEAFVPQMLNYESVGGVSFKKGCYPGQEVVARSQFRGTLKRRAFVANVRSNAGTVPQIGQEVFHDSDSEQPCGLVAAAGVDAAGGFSVIVSLQTFAAAAGRLTLGSAHGAEIDLLPLPYALLEDI